MRFPRQPRRTKESGVTILLVAASMFAILAMAALAVDVAHLYVAHTEVQRAADAAALAGAKMFVLSGFTSWQLGDPASGTTQTQICASGSPGSAVANQAAVAAAAANQVSGQAATITTISCNFTSPMNPQITVTASRSSLPILFARIFGSSSSSVSATATAEAFNASGSTVNLGVRSVKPWLIPNCDPAAAPCASGPYFVNSTSGYTLNNPAAYIGQTYTFHQRNRAGTPAVGEYYPIDISPAAATCPSTGAVGCSSVGGGLGTAGYLDNIACANSNPAAQLKCGDSVTLDDKNNLPPAIADTISGTQCLIHTATTFTGSSDQDSFASGPPILIEGGLLNPNPALRGALNISRSDSVVTVPLFTWTGVDPCTGPPPGSCSGTQQVVGFLQLGVNYVSDATATTGDINATVLNAVGCNPANNASAPVSGGGLTPLPVRLVQ